MENFKKFQVERKSNIPFFLANINWAHEGLKISLVSLDGYEKVHLLLIRQFICIKSPTSLINPPLGLSRLRIIILYTIQKILI